MIRAEQHEMSTRFFGGGRLRCHISENSIKMNPYSVSYCPFCGMELHGDG